MGTRFDNVHYRTADGLVDYIFNFVYVSGTSGWRIYIVEQPSYAGRDESAVKTHRLGGPGERYVCWTAPLLDLDDAKTVAAAWADCTQGYIRTGTFPPPPRRQDVVDRSSMASYSGAPMGEERPSPPRSTLWDRVVRFATE